MLGAVTVTSEGRRTVKFVNGIIKGAVCLPQLRRHGVNIVKVG
jgi:hypothetical protein